MKSMTGYAYEEINIEDYSVSVEIKSYNSRFLDLSVNLPSFLSRLENGFREMCCECMLRGKVDVYIKIRENVSGVSVKVDTKAVLEYANALRKIAEALYKPSVDIPLAYIASQEGVLISEHEYDIEAYREKIQPVLQKALEVFVADREREGANLKKDIFSQIEKLEKSQQLFTEWMPKMETAFRESLQQKFHDMLGDAVDEQRVMQETAALLIKYTINEEVVRLASHIQALKNELENNPAPGRKIDFICQELNREINTIGSKNQFTEVGAEVINAKNALENIREQTRNIE